MTTGQRLVLTYRAALFQRDGAMCYKMMTENLARQQIVPAIYWQIASHTAYDAAMKCLDKIRND